MCSFFCEDIAHQASDDEDSSRNSSYDEDDSEDDSEDDEKQVIGLDNELVRAFEALKISNVHFVYVYFDIRYFRRNGMTLERFTDGLFYIGQGQDERHKHDPRARIDPVVDVRERHMEAGFVRFWRVEKIFIKLPQNVANAIEANLIVALQESGKHTYDPLKCMRHWNKKCMCNDRSGRIGRGLSATQQARYGDGQVLLKNVYEFFTVNLFDH